MSKLVKPLVKPEEIHQAIIKKRKEGEKIALEMGRLLFLMHNSKGYEKLGCKTWGEYLGLPEVGISRAQAGKLMEVYYRFCVIHKKKIEELPSSVEKLYLAAKLTTDAHRGSWDL